MALDSAPRSAGNRNKLLTALAALALLIVVPLAFALDPAPSQPPAEPTQPVTTSTPSPMPASNTTPPPTTTELPPAQPPHAPGKGHGKGHGGGGD